MPKADCILYKQVVRGDVVAVRYDFNSRRFTYNLDLVAYSVNAHIEQTSNKILGVPSNPIVYRVRDDLSWQDVSSSFPVRLFLNGLFLYN